VTGAKVRRRVRRDAAGNVVALLQAERVPEAIEFRLVAVLERVRDDGPAVLAAQALHSPRLLRPTPLTAADERLRAMAADIVPDAARPGEDPEGTAERICAAVFEAITYQYGVTSVTTTAAGALAVGRGVCQDYAHVMLALCHLLRLPARYVSGHLLGQGGTHAWVEVIVPRADRAEAVAFDPCHGRRTDGGYVTVATGRDYSDVAPTSGSYVGTSPGRLTAGRRVGVLTAALPKPRTSRHCRQVTCRARQRRRPGGRARAGSPTSSALARRRAATRAAGHRPARPGTASARSRPPSGTARWSARSCTSATGR
jgi:transglutaminase-like putative cysteine protease